MRLETDRLYIRSLKEDDWQDMKEIFIDFSKSEYACFGWPMPTDDEGAIELTKSFAQSSLCFAVFLKEPREMIGYDIVNNGWHIFLKDICTYATFSNAS